MSASFLHFVRHTASLLPPLCHMGRVDPLLVVNSVMLVIANHMCYAGARPRTVFTTYFTRLLTLFLMAALLGVSLDSTYPTFWWATYVAAATLTDTEPKSSTPKEEEEEEEAATKNKTAVQYNGIYSVVVSQIAGGIAAALFPLRPAKENNDHQWYRGGVLLGNLLGGLVMLLDWQQPWQSWPVPPTMGAIGGAILGLFAVLVTTHRQKLLHVLLEMLKLLVVLVVFLSMALPVWYIAKS